MGNETRKGQGTAFDQAARCGHVGRRPFGGNAQARFLHEGRGKTEADGRGVEACQNNLAALAQPADQREAFAWHIDLAKRVGKPLMIHNREADDDVLDVLRAEGPPETVIFHCFSSGPQMARVCLEAGWILSLSGTVSFKNAHALREAATLIPPGQLLVETDAPFLTPHPFRGAPNEPYCLPYTVRALADLLDLPAAQVAQDSAATARRVYRID